MRLAIQFLVVALGLAVVSNAFAQGCAMCSTAAAATDPSGARSLNLGILVLLVPTLVMFVGVLVTAIRRAAN